MQSKKRFNFKPAYRFAVSVFCCLLVLTGLINAHTVSDSKYGVCAHLNGENILKKLHNANISWVRMDFSMALVYPTLSDFLVNDPSSWDVLEQLIDPATDPAKELNMFIYATIIGVPSWATSGDKSAPTRDVIFTNPVTQEEMTGVDAWKEFVYRAMVKYTDRITHWGIENEPDEDNQFNGTKEEYVYDMLIPAARVIRTYRRDNNLNLKVCAPDLWDRCEYLDYVLNNAGNFVDIVTVHSYGDVFWVMSELDGFVSHAQGKPVWLTETGYFKCPHDSSLEMRAQALWYNDFLTQFQTRNDISKLFTFHAFDGVSETDRYGIIYRPSGSPLTLRPAYHEYRWFAGSNNASFVANPDPIIVLPGGTFQVSLTVENTGTLYWDSNFRYRLDFLDRGLIPLIIGGSQDVIRTEDNPVKPGDQYTFYLELQAPVVPGTYSIFWQMYQDIEPADGSDIVRRFGSTGITLFTVSPCLALPQFITEPQSQTVDLGDTVRFSVEVTEPETYQWRRNGTPISNGGRISGADTAVLTISNAQFYDEGNYRCHVTNCMGGVTSNLGVLTVQDPQQPYHGVPFAIPGRIQAEDYDLGGEGIAYHDTTVGNNCDPPRQRDDDVDIQLTYDSGGGNNVGYIEQSEWLEYTIQVSQTNYYDINVRAAAPGGGSFHIKLNGADITGTRSFNATGGNQVWETITIPRIPLYPGKHILQFYALQSNFNLNWIDIAISQQAPYTTHTIPGTIQAEDYDTGGQGIAYNDTTPTNDCYYQAYRFEGVDVENSPDSGPNTINVGYIYTGEWLEYTVEVPQGRNYQLNIRAAAPTGGALSLEADGMPLTGTIIIPASNQGAQDYTTISVPNIFLPEGKMIIRINMEGNLFNLDYLQFQ